MMVKDTCHTRPRMIHEPTRTGTNGKLERFEFQGPTTARSRDSFTGGPRRLLQQVLGEAACRQLGIYPDPRGFKLSVVIPVYNEKRGSAKWSAGSGLCRFPRKSSSSMTCSTDGTRDILPTLEGEESAVVLSTAQPGQGCGFARRLQAGHRHVIFVQDADLEYDPAEYPRLIQPIIENQADVVYGSRFHRR